MGWNQVRHGNRHPVFAGIPDGAIQLIDSQDRALVRDLLRANEYVDMIIPRGGAALHQFALENASVPVITGGIGVCHIFVDKSADMARVAPIVHNAKVQRPTVCNALDTLLVHQDVAANLLMLFVIVAGLISAPSTSVGTQTPSSGFFVMSYT